MLEEDGRHGVTGWVSSWLGGRGAQSVPNTPQRPTSSQSLNSVRNNTHKDTLAGLLSHFYNEHLSEKSEDIRV